MQRLGNEIARLNTVYPEHITMLEAEIARLGAVIEDARIQKIATDSELNRLAGVIEDGSLKDIIALRLKSTVKQGAKAVLRSPIAKPLEPWVSAFIGRRRKP